MQLIEVQNNIAKVLYKISKIRLMPSDFLLIEDVNQKLIAQITGIQTTENADNNIALLKLSLSIDNDDKLSLYNGYIPSKKSKIIYINPDEIMELIKGDSVSFYFGTLANHPQCYVKTNIDFFNNKLYIRSDKEDMTSIVLKNIVFELKNKNKKTVIIDTEGKYSGIKDACVIKVTEDLKFPLNADAFNNIIEKDIDDCNLEDRAIIQSIILEVREYIQTLKNQFIPFSSFKDVVDDIFLSNPSSGLMMFRNKLWMYSQNHLFSETDECFNLLDDKLDKSSIVVIDISAINSNWYNYAIKTVLNLINKKCYLILSLEDFPSDKKFITNLYNKNSIIPIVTTSYGNKNSQVIKSVCQNYLFCKPASLCSETELYTDLLNRINSEEIILFGEGTLYLPIIAELKPIDENVAEEVIDNEIKKDVDKLLLSSNSVISPEVDTSEITEEQNFNTEEEELLDSDLDFLDEISAETAENDNPYDIFTPETEENSTNADSEIEFNDNSEKINEVFEEIQDDNPSDIVNTDIENNEPEENNETEENNVLSDLETEFNDNSENISEVEEEILSDSSVETISPDYEEVNNDENTIDDILEEENIPEPLQEESTEIISDTQNDFIPEQDETEEIINNDLVKNDEEQSQIQNSEENNTEDIDSIIESIYNDDSQNDNADGTEDMTSIDDVVNGITSRIENDEGAYIQDTEETASYNANEEDNQKVDEDVNDEVDEEETTIEKQSPPEIKPAVNIKQKRELPVYETDMSAPLGIEDLPFKTGDTVYHPKHGRGIVEGFTNYSNKILFCQINFENVGRRILDPRVAGIEKAE